MRKVLFAIIIILFQQHQSSCQTKEQTLHQLNKLLVDVVMDDLFTPPIASRIYVYPHIAFYECIRNDDLVSIDLSGKLNGLKKLPKPGSGIDHFVSACVAYCWVAQGLVGSEYKIENWREYFLDSIRNKLGNDLVDRSAAFGRKMADSINAWIRKDNYLETRGMLRHVISKKDGGWSPTPTEYAPGMEPHWNKIRPMTLSSANMFSPKAKLVYNPSKQSIFYKNVKEVYDIDMNLDTNKRLIAKYWDDNPNASVVEGHLSYYIHKISPGGHWMRIAEQALEQKNIPLVKASLIYSLTGIALFDAFIATWDEKYKTDLIRPVTVINQNINENWKPYLDTPPFPEFTSGHAVISNAAALVLTRTLGDNYAFTDYTEIPFGLEPRKFSSFLDAAKEASWSRVYGGIHYPETARISISTGQLIGNYVYQKLVPKGFSK